MSTPLLCKALELCSTIFAPILNQHIITLNPTTEKFSIEARYFDRKRFHISNFVLTIMFCLGLHFLARHIYEPGFKYKYYTPFGIELTTFTLVHLILTFINQAMGRELYVCVNEVLQFERKLFGPRMVRIGYATKVGHWKLIQQGMLKTNEE